MDWSGLMRLGMQGLGLAPDAFWRLTPAELRLLSGAGGVAPLGRARLDELVRAFPDGMKGDENGGS